MAETQARKEWTKENTTFVGLKLNNRTDKDILEALEGKPKQTEIKRLIRQGLKRELTENENRRLYAGLACAAALPK